MPRYAWSTIIAAALLGAGAGPSNSAAGNDAPKFTSDGKLRRPTNYREWVFLSSGLGMTYGPAAAEARENTPMFDNVFVSRPAYQAFLNDGRWPDQTMFILEVRRSQSKGSINNGGHFQTEIVAIEAEVKDEKRFPGKWMFFDFGKDATETKAIPTTAGCYSCHAKNGAVDNTFVQFYPTLAGVAKAKGTWRGE